MKIKKYAACTLPELEAARAESYRQLRQNPADRQARANLSSLRYLIQKRCQEIKAQAMRFEKHNHQFLLIYESTHGYLKMAGHSALFFSQKIATQLGRRCSLQIDTDHYSVSSDGIVSVRHLDILANQLAAANIILDKGRSTTELHFFKMPFIYDNNAISQLRRTRQTEQKRLAQAVRPRDPNPKLYLGIQQLFQLCYFAARNLRVDLDRQLISKNLVTPAQQMLFCYSNCLGTRGKLEICYQLPFLNALTTKNFHPNSLRAKMLLDLLAYSYLLGDACLTIEPLQVLPRSTIDEIVSLNTEIQQLAEHDFFRVTKEIQKRQGIR